VPDVPERLEARLPLARPPGRLRTPIYRVAAALGALVLLTALGSLGYVVIEDANPIAALYMTVITLSTVGFGEAFPLSRMGQLYTTALIAVGVGFALYLLSVIAETVLEGRLRDLYWRNAMLREIARLRGHVIVCGYGRFGQVVATDLIQAGRQVVVIDQDDDLEAELNRVGVTFVLGSATSDETLELAGIRKASAVVVAISSEAECVFVTLAARELNHDVQIHARSESEAAVRRLRRAGANHVTSPFQMGGARTAASILRPTVVDFLELSGGAEEIDLEEIRIDAGAEIAGVEVKELEEGSPRLRIVALKHEGRPMELVPDRSAKVAAGDHLVVIGERAQLERLAERAQGAPG